MLIELLVDKSILSPADLGDMYFNGKADLLVSQLTAKLDPSFRYSAFISLVNAGKVADAMSYVRDKSGAVNKPTESEKADEPEETGEKEEKKATSDEDDLEKMLALLSQQIAADEQDTDADENQKASEDVDLDLLWASVDTKLGAHAESLKNWMEYRAEGDTEGEAKEQGTEKKEIEEEVKF